MVKMFKLFFLLIFLVPVAAISQQVTEKNIVTDSAGNVLPYVIWSKLVFTGYYELWTDEPKKSNPNYYLKRVSEEEREKKMVSYGKPQPSRAFRNGEKIDGFKAEDLAGNKFNIDELKGKIVVINFWFIKCAPCQFEIPELNKVVEKYKGNPDVVFLGIALDDKPDLEAFLKRIPFNYNIIYNGRSFAQQFNVTGYPTHAIIDRKGKVYFHTVGLAQNTVYWIEKSIAELLN